MILSYSGRGLAALSHNYHRTLRRHVCRGKYRDIPRPVLINNWEATYFDFTGDKILEIARRASGLGVEMLVLDDGWFGKRDNDSKGLGDWQVNEEKLGGPLSNLVAVSYTHLQYVSQFSHSFLLLSGQIFRRTVLFLSVLPTV